MDISAAVFTPRLKRSNFVLCLFYSKHPLLLGLAEEFEQSLWVRFGCRAYCNFKRDTNINGSNTTELVEMKC